MGWKENKKKHDDYVNFVTKVLSGYYQICTIEDYLKKEIEDYLKKKYKWKYPRNYDMKLISKRKNKYHFRIIPYDIIEDIDIRIDISRE